MKFGKIYTLLCGLLLLISFAPVLAAIEIVPSAIDVSITGGDSIVKNITLSNTESYPVACKLSTVILPDEDGINVTYRYLQSYCCNPVFVLLPFAVCNLEMRINASISLKPQAYSIQTTLQFTDQKELRNNPHRSRSSPSTFYHTDIPDLIPANINDTTLLDDDNTSFNNDTYVPPPLPYNYSLHYLVIILALIISFTLLCLFKKKMEKKKK